MEKNILKEMHFKDLSALVGRIILSKVLKTVLTITVCKVKMDSGERESF